MRKIYFLLYFFYFISSSLAGNSKKDSLQNLLEQSKSDTSKIYYYIEIGKSEHKPEDAFYWYLKAFKSCNVLLSQTRDTKVSQSLEKLKYRSLKELAYAYQEKDDYISSIITFKKIIEHYSKTKDSLSWTIALLNNGNNFFRIGKLTEALDCFQQSANLFDKLGDKKGESFCFNNIGSIHAELSNYKLALDYWSKTLIIKRTLGDSIAIAITLNNLGTNYKNLKDYDNSISTYMQALNIYKSFDDVQGVSMIYSNLSNIYKNKNDYETALRYANLALELKKKIDDENGLAIVYGNIGLIYNKLNKYNQAIDACKTGRDYALKIGALAALKSNYESLADSYAHIGDMTNAYDNLRNYEIVKDSLFNIEKNKEFARLEMQYQVEKKQQEIEKQLAIIKKKEAIAEKNETQRNALFGGVVLMLLLLVAVLYSYIQKRKDNFIISEKNQNLEVANAEILAQRDEIEAQRDLVEMQKKQIEFIHIELKDSINYGQRIQQSLLPTDEFLSTLFNQSYFKFYRPRDVVSGDFYWAEQINEWNLFAVADCTGHGVPGAFMSMLGISILNEIIREKEVITTSELLKLLYTRLSQNLHRSKKESEVNDTMDIAFCAWNTKTHELQYSGINRPLYLIRDAELSVLQPTKMISFEKLQHKFINAETIKIKNNDIIILSSDGYIDQFGGPKGKKFKKINFHNLILSLYDNPIETHEKIVETTFLEWKGSHSQLDDICILGIQFDME